MLVAGALVLAPMLLYPFGSDQGSFATVAEVIGRGGRLYRDVFEIKPPGTYYLFLSAFRVFGHTMFAVRLLDLLWTLGAAATLAMVGERLLGRAAGMAGAFLFLSFYALGFDFWHTAQCDGFTSLPLALAALTTVLAESRRSRRLAALSGLFLGLAVLVKFTIGGLLLLPLLAAVLAREETWRARVLRIGAYLGGFALPLLLTVLWLVSTGSFAAMREIVFGWNAAYGKIRGADPLGHIWDFLLGGQYLLLKAIGALAITGTVSLVLARRTRPLWWFLPLWAVVMFVGIVAQGKYFAYHWLPALPPVGLLAGEGIAFAVLRLGQPFADRTRRAFPVVAAVVLLALFAAGYWAQFSSEIGYATGRVSTPDYLAQFATHDSYFSFRADLAVADYVKAHTSRDDTLFVWGLEPLVYFLSERRPATRFPHAIPLLTPWSPPAWRQQAITQLETSRPKLILVVHNDAQSWTTGWTGDSYSALVMTYPELRELLDGGYRLAARIEDFDVWERR
jgi:hypothetical protein